MTLEQAWILFGVMLRTLKPANLKTMATEALLYLRDWIILELSKSDISSENRKALQTAVHKALSPKDLFIA